MMKLLLLAALFIQSLFASQILKTLEFEERDKSILLSLKKEPELLLRQSVNIYGTSLSKNVQTIAFELENLSGSDMKELALNIRLFEVSKEVEIESLKSGETKKLFFSFPDIELLRNSQKETIHITLKSAGKIWKFSQEALLNRGVFKVYFPNIDLYEYVELDIEGLKRRRLEKGRDFFLIPLFSDRRYSFKVLKDHKEAPLFFEIDKLYLFSPKNEILQIREVFDFQSTKIRSASKEIYNLSFTMPELLDMQNQEIKKIDLKHTGFLNRDIKAFFQSDAYDIFLKENRLVIRVLKKSADFVPVDIADNGSVLYTFMIAPPIKRIYDSSSCFLIPRGTQIYDDSAKEILYLAKNESIVSPLKTGGKWVTFKDRDTLKTVKAKKESLFAVLGDNRLFIEELTRKEAFIRVSPEAQRIATIPANSMISGYIRGDGWIEYINSLWWIHAVNIELELDFLLRPNYLLRTGPWGKKAGLNKEYAKIRGLYVSEEWIKILGFYDQSGYTHSEKELYVHRNALLILNQERVPGCPPARL